MTESRAVVAHAVMAALPEVRLLAGPAGLAFDPDLGHAADDLGLYASQLNVDVEATRLGSALRAGRRLTSVTRPRCSRAAGYPSRNPTARAPEPVKEIVTRPSMISNGRTTSPR